MRAAAQAKVWHSTMTTLSRRSTVILLGLAAIALAFAIVVARHGGRLPTAQSQTCAVAYARARTAAESTVVDNFEIGASRVPGRYTCADERAILRRRR